MSIRVDIENLNYPAAEFHYRVVTQCGSCGAMDISHVYNHTLDEDLIDGITSALEDKGWHISEDINDPHDLCPKCAGGE